MIIVFKATTTTTPEIIIIVECENLFIKQCGLKLMLERGEIKSFSFEICVSE